MQLGAGARREEAGVRFAEAEGLGFSDTRLFGHIQFAVRPFSICSYLAKCSTVGIGAVLSLRLRRSAARLRSVPVVISQAVTETHVDSSVGNKSTKSCNTEELCSRFTELPCLFLPS